MLLRQVMKCIYQKGSPLDNKYNFHFVAGQTLGNLIQIGNVRRKYNYVFVNFVLNSHFKNWGDGRDVVSITMPL